MKSIINVQNISKKFGEKSVLKNLSFQVKTGEVIAIIGPSGSGKSTLLRCLNHLTQIDSGKIELDSYTILPGSSNLDLHSLREKVGMVFQQYNLWPHKTIIENIITSPLLVKKITKPDALKSAQILLKRVGLSNKANDYPYTLSSGQQQRVALARALAMEPEILLLDEITSALDPELVGEVLSVIKKIVKDRRRTILLVTHEMGFARDVADRVIFLDHGSIVEQGPAHQIFHKPRRARTRKFLQKILKYRF